MYPWLVNSIGQVGHQCTLSPCTPVEFLHLGLVFKSPLINCKLLQIVTQQNNTSQLARETTRTNALQAVLHQVKVQRLDM